MVSRNGSRGPAFLLEAVDLVPVSVQILFACGRCTE